MKTRIRCAISYILSTFAFLWAFGIICYEWGHLEDFSMVNNWYKIIFVYEGLLVLLTILCFFNHPYTTRKVLLVGAIYSSVWPPICFVKGLLYLISMWLYPIWNWKLKRYTSFQAFHRQLLRCC